MHAQPTDIPFIKKRKIMAYNANNQVIIFIRIYFYSNWYNIATLGKYGCDE